MTARHAVKKTSGGEPPLSPSPMLIGTKRNIAHRSFEAIARAR
jgi:hypothetical protein